MPDERTERIRKAESLRADGHNPYPYCFDRTHTVAIVLANFERLAASHERIALAGRVMARRHHGRTAFLAIEDASGRLQAYVRADTAGDTCFSVYERCDLGDILALVGTAFETRTGEKSIMVRDLAILCKALRPLPSEWYGLKNVETRYRQRYLDLIMNPVVRDVFQARARIVEIVRRVFNAKGGIEVETPTLQPLYGGASARPFITHHNALDIDLYLRIADELYLKRLIVGGFECVYEICKDFRNEGMDRSHNPEFTMVEIYWAYKDYNDMMNLTEELLVTIARELTGGTLIHYQGQRIDLTPPWPRRPMLSLIAEHAGIDAATASDAQLRRRLQELALPATAPEANDTTAGVRSLTRARLVAELFDHAVEPHLIQPTFVTDFPKEMSPLAKQHRDDASLTERFELFIARREMANAFSELNDPLDQRARFEAQHSEREAGDEEAQPLDEDFLRALEYGMPPTGGLGIGIDRLVMLFTDQASIQDVILFPHMRPDR